MAEYYIDALGEICPVPNLRAQSKYKELNPGDVLILETDHSCAATNIVNDMRKRGVWAKSQEIDNGIWQVIIKKKS